MRVPIEIERSIEVPAPPAQVRALLDDIEGTIRRFPKLKKLTHLGDTSYRWDMDTIGSRMANIAHSVSYGAKYKVDPKAGMLSWTSLPGQGNATIEGAFRIEPRGAKGTRLSFRVRGELRDVPVPLMYRLLAPPFIQGKFTRLVDTFLERTREAMAAGAAP
ncbi:MAG TPA: SRPBCC family protein [Solimonas sp.]|nr:SRPBCC family protein [Solimonas sp.]